MAESADAFTTVIGLRRHRGDDYWHVIGIVLDAEHHFMMTGEAIDEQRADAIGAHVAEGHRLHVRMDHGEGIFLPSSGN
jgi:hypothetical protein